MAADPDTSTDEEFTEREKRALKHVAKDALDKMPNRRSFLAGLTGAAAAGAVGYNEGVSQAKAAPSTSDTDGDVGTPSRPVDVFADGVDAVSVGADEIVTESPNPRVWAASNNHADLPSVAEAVSMASQKDTIHILPGAHSVSGDVNPNDKWMNWVFHGHLVTAGDNPAITFAGGHIQMSGYQESAVSLIVDATNTTTTHAVRYRWRNYSSGMLGVRGGAPGHHIVQDSVGGNGNGQRLALFAFQANGDGVRMENTTANAPNLNAGEYYVYATGCSGAGLNIVTGLENTFQVVSESNNRGLHVQSGGDRNSFWIRSIESSTNEGVLVDSLAEANQVFETVNNSDPVTDNGSRTLFDMTGSEDLGTSPSTAPSAGYPDGAVIRNSNADNNETWEKVRGTFVQIA